MKRLLVLLALCMAFAMVIPAVAGVASADSFVDLEDVIVDLLPTKQLSKDGHVTAANCDVKYERDGSVKITITGANPMLTATWIDGTTVYQGGPIDLSENAYFCIDFGVTGSAGIGDQTIFYYTRKDKAAANDLAQLWYVSMAVSGDYASYRTQHHLDETGGYVVWDWGKYINDGAATKLFDDKIHRFMRMEMPLTGAVGDTITLYSLCVVNNPDTNGLGDVRPVADEPTESSEEPAPIESSEEPAPAETSEETEPVESTEEPEPVESSEAEPAPVESSEEEPVPAESSEDEPAPAESSEAPSEEPSAQASEESKPAEQPAGGFPWWGILLICVGGVALIGAIVAIILKNRK